MRNTEQLSFENKVPKKVIVIGAGGHGRVIADIITCTGDIVLGFLDDKDPNQILDIPYLGQITDFIKYQQDTLFIVAIGDNHTRKQIMESYDLNWYTAIHPSAVIAPDVEIAEGAAIMANAVINTGSKIGKGVIVNTAATVDHDNVLANYVHISPGAHLGGTVNIDSETWIGIGAVVSNNIDICGESVVGAGAVVIHSINLSGVYAGVPAKMMKQN